MSKCQKILRKQLFTNSSKTYHYQEQSPMNQHNKSNKPTKKKHTAFLAGHLTRPYNDPVKLKSYFAGKYPGFVNLEIPAKRWKGYGFVIFSTKKDLEKFVTLKEIHLGTSTLLIKSHKSGNQLDSTRKEIQLRRIHFRAVGPNPVQIDLKTEFNHYGEVENAYFVKNSKKNVREGNMTVVGFILFKKRNAVVQLLNSKSITINGCQFHFKKNRTLENENQRNHKYGQLNHNRRSTRNNKNIPDSLRQIATGQNPSNTNKINKRHSSTTFERVKSSVGELSSSRQEQNLKKESKDKLHEDVYEGERRQIYQRNTEEQCQRMVEFHHIKPFQKEYFCLRSLKSYKNNRSLNSRNFGEGLLNYSTNVTNYLNHKMDHLNYKFTQSKPVPSFNRPIFYPHHYNPAYSYAPYRIQFF